MPVFYLNFKMILGFIAAISLFPSCSLQNPVSARSISFESIPLAPVTGPITAQFVSEASGFDGSKLSAVNSTSYDWWYFDVASPDQSLRNHRTMGIPGRDISQWHGFPVLPSINVSSCRDH
ncbi:hypothetical protein V8E51_008740 [Hyaloscypha variabilis]